MPVRTPSQLGIESVLDMAVITPQASWDKAMTDKLDAVAGRVLKR